MLKIENTDVFGWESAIRGMRNPLNSWKFMDSRFERGGENGTQLLFTFGENDLRLAQNLANAGNDHGKFLRMVDVTMDITAPLYWWKEFDTYKVGTVANSCSTMHKIQAKRFTPDDFSVEHLSEKSLAALNAVLDVMNEERRAFLDTKDKDCWWQMIQLLPTSYNQKRTVQLNYAVLRNQYASRKNHKLDEWHTYCDWIQTLPYAAELITTIRGDVQ